MFVLPIVEECSGYTEKTVVRLGSKRGFVVSDSGSSIMKGKWGGKFFSQAFYSGYSNITIDGGNFKLKSLMSLLMYDGLLRFGNADVLVYAKVAGDNMSVDLVYIFHNKMICFTMYEFRSVYMFLLEVYNGDLLPCLMCEKDALLYKDNCTDESYSFRTIVDDSEKSRILRGLL